MKEAKIHESSLNVKEIFKRFCKERHAEDKGKHFDYLQETYANTELFDLSFIPYDDNPILYFTKKDNKIRLITSSLKDISLPFASQFIKSIVPADDEIEEGSEGVVEYVFIKEFSPSILTGTIYYVTYDSSLNMPFTIYTERGEIIVDIKGMEEPFQLGHNYELTEEVQHVFSLPLHTVIKAVKYMCNLPKHSVVSDTPKHSDYYTRKHGSTIKVCKPIYYVLNKDEEKEKRTYKRIKPLGHLAFDHSFKVIGHWRRINPHTYGKNRQGEYVVTGMTWVREHTRGEGELMKKIRVVK